MGDGATKLALLIIFIGFVIHTIGFGAPYWQVVGSKDLFRAGLWQICVINSCNEVDAADFTKIGFDNWFQAVRTLECFGLIGSIAVIIFVLLYSCIDGCSTSKGVAIWNLILCFVTGSLILAAIIIFGAKSNNFAWAFGLTAGGGVCYILAGISMFFSMRSI